ncbi:MAG: glycosyltransferase [Nitrospira sp.]|nr:glycosyltransferase [Nitrospira sp.]
MRIGIVISVNQASGGIYHYTASLLKALHQRNADDEFVIFKWPGNVMPLNEFIGPKWQMAEMIPDIVSRHEDIQPNLAGDGLALNKSGVNTRARRFFSEHGVDLLIYPAPISLSFECGIPYIMAIHDLQHRLQPEFPEVSAGGDWQFREYLFRNGVRYAHGILVDSEVGKEDVLTFYGDYISEGHVHPLPFLPSYMPGMLNISDKHKEEVRIKYNLPGRYLFYPAQFWLHKNHARLIHAVHQLRTRHKTDCPLILVGSNTGPKHEAREIVFQNAMFLAGQLGVQDLVKYLGYVPDGDMPALYSMATALTMPTFFGPTNIPILEAWSFDCPVLTSDIRGIREQVDKAGLLVNPKSAESIADGILKLWSDDTLCNSLKKAGRERLASYSMEDFSTRLFTAMEDIRKRTGTTGISVRPENKAPYEQEILSTREPVKSVFYADQKPRLFFYRLHRDFELPPQFCYLIMPLLFKTKLESEYRVEIDPKYIRFDDATVNSETDGRWKDYKFDPALFEIVQDPEDADFMVFPYLLEEFIESLGIQGTTDFIRKLPYFKAYENKHVFMTFHDDSRNFHTSAVLFRTSVNRYVKDLNAIPFPYPVGDLAESTHFDISKMKFQTSFVGYIGSFHTRALLVESIKKESNIKSYLDPSDTFYGNLAPAMRAERRKGFLDSIADSLTVLCPRGTGENTYRFFETMSMGRIPVLIADSCALPFEDEIDYDSFILRIPESEVMNAGTIIVNWLSQHSTEELIEKCRKSRQIWKIYFKCSEWNKRILQTLAQYKKKLPQPDKTWLNSELRITQIPDSGGMIEVNGVKGFLCEGDIHFLFEKARNLPRNGIIVEIGSFMGLSSVIMAHALLATQNYGARIYCIDTWEGSPEHATLNEVKNKQLFDIFLSNIKKSGVSSFIHPIHKASVDAASEFADQSIDILYIDGDHSFEGCYSDLKAWYPKLHKNGILFGHDCVPEGGVRQALEKFSGEYDLAYTILDAPITHYMFEIFLRDSSEALNQQAVTLLQIGKREEAKSILLDIIKRSPTYHIAYNNLALILWDDGDFENAVKYFEDALRTSNFDRSVVFSYGDMLSSHKKYAKAKELYKAYLKTNPNDSEIHSLLKRCDDVLGKVKKLSQVVEGIK